MNHVNWLIALPHSLTTDRYARERPANQPVWAFITMGVIIALALLARGVYELWRILR